MLIITELPSEVLLHLFTFLKATHLAILRRTCNTFRDLISLDTVWMEKCFREFKIESLEGWNVDTYYDLYTKEFNIGSLEGWNVDTDYDLYKVLHRYGFLIGLWQAEMQPYGTMINIQHEKGKLVGSEIMAPCPPHMHKAMRKKLMFSVELNEENIAETFCHMGPNRLSHKCNIFPEDNNKNRVCFRCCVEAAHRNPGGMRREFEQFMMDESWEIEEAIFTGKIELLQKFRVLKKFEASFDLNRIILPVDEPDVVIKPGLYKADYAIFGYELIHVFYNDEKNKIMGKKVTGDPRVPAGQIAFEGKMDKPMFLLGEHQESLANMEERGHDPIPEGIHYKLLPEQDFFLPQNCSYEGKIPSSCSFRFHAMMNISPVNENTACFLPSHLIVFNQKSFALLAFQAETLFTYLGVEETFS